MSRGIRLDTKAVFVVLSLLLFVATSGYGQGASAITETGIQRNRDYLTLQPFEAIDTASGNILLTFVDLELPGNAGGSLRFERVFSGHKVAGPGGIPPLQWHFGVNGLPYFVGERDTYWASDLGSLDWHRRSTAHLFMPDGSRHDMMFEQTPNLNDASTLRWTITPQFWRYDRQDNKLYVPDGTVATYGSDGWLTSFSDRFGSVVTLTWSPGALQVVQALGNGQSRVVDIELDAVTRLPKTLTYDTKIWTYQYETGGESCCHWLTRVTDPAGGAWVFEYETSLDAFTERKVKKVVTPHGGDITYTYRLEPYHYSYMQGTVPVEEVRYLSVLATRAVGGREIEPGTWTFAYTVAPSGAVESATVTTPSARVVFEYQRFADVLAGGFALARRSVYELGGGPAIEQENRQYKFLRGWLDQGWAVPVVERIVTTRHGREYVTEYTFDESAGVPFANYHRPVTVRELDGGVLQRTTTLQYQHFSGTAPYVAALPRLTAVAQGSSTSSRGWEYDGDGFRTSESVDGITTTFVRGQFGNVATERKANGKETFFEYDWSRVKRMSTSEPGYEVVRTINANGTTASETVAGRTTTFQYDAAFRVISSDPPGTSVAATTTYDNTTGATVTLARGLSAVTTTLDGFARPLRTEDSAGVRTRVRYDAEGRRIYQSLPFVGSFGGATDIGTEFTYDALGRVTREDVARNTPGAAFRTRSYGANTVTITDENGHATVSTHRAFGHPDATQLTQLRDAANQIWAYEYNAAGQLTEVNGPDGVERTWTYDATIPSLLRSETHPESGTVSFPVADGYDAAGLVTTRQDANGTVFTYQYDGNGRVKTITATPTTGTASVTTITYEPGSDHRQRTVVDGVTTDLVYDAAGRLATRTDTVDGKAFVTEFAYDGNDNLELITYPSGRKVKYAYGAENRLTRVFNPDTQANYATDFAYHPSGAPTSYKTDNNIVTTLAYHPQRYWLTDIDAGEMHIDYRDHDGVGNVRTILDSRPTFATQTFTYDSLDRLATANGPYGSGTFVYDAHGNRTGGLFGYDPANRFRLTSYDGLPMTYDGNGNMTTRSADTFAYTPDNLMKTATVGGTATNYAYDADAWRVKKAVTGGATTYFVRGPNGQLLMEWVNTSPLATIREYVYAGSRLIAIIKGEAATK